MGRKIPGKKHKGIKNPLEQLAKKNEMLKHKINAPPDNPDIQEIPKSVIELNRLRQMVKDGKFQKKKKKKKYAKDLIDISKFNKAGPKLPGMVQKDKLLPRLRQMEGESEAGFLNRVNSATEDIIKEAFIEKKYNVTINRSSDGSIENIDNDTIPRQCKKDISKKKQNLNQNKTTQNLNGEKVNKLNRKQRLKLKKAKKKSEFEQDGLVYKTDHVEFGEVVHAPPHLSVRPKGSDHSNFDKPGSRNLLLNGIINASKNKKEKLSIPQQKLFDKRREDVINAYRNYKKCKSNQFDSIN